MDWEPPPVCLNEHTANMAIPPAHKDTASRPHHAITSVFSECARLRVTVSRALNHLPYIECKPCHRPEALRKRKTTWGEGHACR